jgi:hypothetical protein
MEKRRIQAHPKTGAKQAANQKDDETAAKSAHGASSAIDLSMVRNTRGRP